MRLFLGQDLVFDVPPVVGIEPLVKAPDAATIIVPDFCVDKPEEETQIYRLPEFTSNSDGNAKLT